MSQPLSDPTPPPPATSPGQAVQVLSAEAVYVSHGVNLGDPLAGAGDVVPGDVYVLDPDIAPRRLVVARGPRGQVVGTASQIGTPDEPITCSARYSLMADDGGRVELLFLQLGSGVDLVLPLSPISAEQTYQLVSVEEDPGEVGLSDLLCVSFARGTIIALQSGAARPIESLKIGDRILTRDHGGQELRWIGKATLRAVGAFAPVVITAGTLGNSGDLIVSQHHRIFLYQRRKRAGMRHSELLVQAKHLVDGDRVFLREGGFVDYYSLVFDRHEIVYAEGIPAESLMVNDATVSMLPPEISEEVRRAFPGLAQLQHFGTEAGRNFLAEIGPESLFTKPRSRGQGG